MKKKLIIILAILVVLLIAATYTWYTRYNRPLVDDETTVSGGLTPTGAVPTSPPSISVPPGPPPG